MKRRRYLGLATATLAGLAGCMGDTEYTVADISVAGTTGPLELEVEAVDTGVTVNSPALLDITLRNNSEEAVTVRNTGVWPLGLLALVPPGERGPEGVLLLSDQYAKTDHVEVTAKSTNTDNVPIDRPLDAGEAVTKRYEMHGDRFYDPGTRTLRGYFEEVLLSYRTGDAEDWTEFAPGVSVTIEERSPLP